MEERNITMPVVALRGLTVLPGMTIHFDVSREKSVKAVEKAMVGDQKVFLTAQKDPEIEDPTVDQLCPIGTVSMVKQLVKLPGGIVRVMVDGMGRGELVCLDSDEPMLMGEIQDLPMEKEDLDYLTAEAMSRVLKEKLEEYGKENQRAAKEILPALLGTNNLEELLEETAVQLPFEYRARQTILESMTVTEKYERVLKALMDEISIVRIKREFQMKVKEAIDKNQRDYILREQLRVIRDELGEDSPGTEGDEYERQLEQLKADKETKEKIRKEISRFKTMPSGSQEANVLRTYIETLLELPWNKMSKDNQDLKRAEEILNHDHYGLEKVKERIIEYLAVRTLTKKQGSTILFETFVTVRARDASVVLPATDKKDYFDYLTGRDFWDINDTARRATMRAHSEGGIPCLELSIPAIDAHTLGELFYFFLFSCYLSCRLVGVNPFNQPGVESYKGYMFKNLGKPGAK